MQSTDKAREDLLKEAALIALFDHRNVLSIIGVITSPRNLPAFIVLPYCDRGSLHAYLLEGSGGVPIHTKLTFCAEIARGLGYIAARRVIHRDVAARNILLDILLVCKVADFGMSTRLNDTKEYTRINHDQPDENELPLRWAAPEVVKEGKYSLQSDVWAFGVLIWEVFSKGKTPYENLTVLEVIDHIRNNTVLSGPISALEYPSEIYDKLMAVCFYVDPLSRPSFGELYDTCIQLGGSEDEVAVDEYRKKQQGSIGSQSTCTSVVLSHNDVMARRGPSVHHLTTAFIRRTMRSMKKNMRLFPRLEHAEDALIRNMVDVYGRPAGLHMVCPRDGESGAAYVDTLEGADNVGIAIALLSYSWGYKVKDVVNALAEWTRTQGRDPRRTYIWICSLCLNQHRIFKPLTPDKLAKEFGDRVTGIGRILPMLEDWKNPGYTRRAWCLFELYTALRMNAHVIDVDIILTPTQRELCAIAIQTHGFKVIDEALDQVNSENAEATEQADLAAIQALIQRYQGGYSALNEAVKMRLRTWFQKIAGIRFARSLGSSDRIKLSSTTSFSSNRTRSTTSSKNYLHHHRNNSNTSSARSSVSEIVGQTGTRNQLQPPQRSTLSSTTLNSAMGGEYHTLINDTSSSHTTLWEDTHATMVDEVFANDVFDNDVFEDEVMDNVVVENEVFEHEVVDAEVVDVEEEGAEVERLTSGLPLATTFISDEPEKNDRLDNFDFSGVDSSSC